MSIYKKMYTHTYELFKTLHPFQALRSCESAVLSALSEKEMDHSLLFDFRNIEIPDFVP